MGIRVPPANDPPLGPRIRIYTNPRKRSGNSRVRLPMDTFDRVEEIDPRRRA